MPSNAQIRDQAHQILQGEDFRAYEAHQETWNVLQWLWEQLRGWFDTPEKSPSTPLNPWLDTPDPAVIKGLILVSVAASLAFLGYALLKRFRPGLRDIERATITLEERLSSRKDYLRRSAEALAEERYREAMHYLFLSGVTMVIEDACFHGTHTMTNREIAAATDFSRFPNEARLQQAFHAMVYVDEPFWFGGCPATKQDYEAFLVVYRQFDPEKMPHAA